MRARLIGRLRRDDGMTLQEMIVTFMLVSVVLLVLGGIYISTIGVQQTVDGLTRSTTDAQLVARQLDLAVRNGSELNVQSVGDGDEMVRVRTIDSSAEGVWFCRAWYYDSSGEGSIRTTSNPDETYIADPSEAELATWTLLVDNVTPPSGGSIFVDDNSLLVQTLAVDFTTQGYEESEATRIKFSTPLMPGETKVETCL